MSSRRRFLKTAASASAAVGLGATLWLPRRAHAFGEFPADQLDLMLPPELRVRNVLEVFLYGGLSPWETFYKVEDYGAPGTDFAGSQFYTFVGGGAGSVESSLQRCGLEQTLEGTYFGNDDDGVPVTWGPYLQPTLARPDVVARTRVLVQAHDLEPHEGAIPLGLTGKRLGAPSLAGLGTHVQAYSIDTGPQDRSVPYSYVFRTGGLSSDNVQAASTTGLHPGRARPLSINVADSQQLTNLLSRPGVTDPETHDALLRHYADRFAGRLTHPETMEVLRAKSFFEARQAASAVEGAPDVSALFPPELLEQQGGTVCTDSSGFNPPAMSLRLAVELLKHPQTPAAYVCVVDTGLIEASGGGGYDTHQVHCEDTARNFKNLQDQLLGVINQPGENDPEKLNLDETLIIINTEFGRTPYAQGGGSGRNHHPYGYTTALIGGPVAKGVVGAIGEHGSATKFVLPSEQRIAALLAMGIFPFSPEAFGLSDVQGAFSEPDAILDVTQRVLGVIA